MHLKTLPSLLCVLALCGCPPWARADESAWEVMRFGGAKKTAVAGKDTMVLTVTPAAAGEGKRLNIVVPNDPPTGPYHPDATMMATISILKNGEVLMLRYDERGGQKTLTQLSPYQLKPGEDSPKGYVFSGMKEEAAGDQTVVTVKFIKLGQTTTAIIPNKKYGNKMAPVKATMELVQKLRSGDVVEVDFQKGDDKNTIQKIELYIPWTAGELVKFTETDVPGQRGLQVKSGDKAETIILAGTMQGDSWKTNERLAKIADKLKPGRMIEYRLVEQEGKKYVKDLQGK
ncbi:MAG TPA: hypothetical protein VIL86_13740 [Tepidisphaeraceae bacterium]|jgi:Cu/Ag efflux protein CusF